MPMIHVLAAATVTNDPALINIAPDATLAYALLGYAVVFLGLVALIIVISIMAKIMVAGQKAKALPTAAAAVVEAVAEVPKEEAKGTAGQVKLFDVPDRDAAMIMAIVANQMKKPLNELRFQSIKEVK